MVFCGVHFMAETADILARPWQQVVLPDLNAGCSMADMAEIGQVEECWESLERQGTVTPASQDRLPGTPTVTPASQDRLPGTPTVTPASQDRLPGTPTGNTGQGTANNDSGKGILPLTYMNSAAEIKAFCGERGGLVCTSSNARAAFEWAFARAEKILFLPDQHLGRNTAYAMGIALSEMVVWDPYQINGGVTLERLRAARVVLWKGHCSVHQRFLPEHVDRVRREEPGMQVVVHPECRWEVCQKADALGSTERIVELIEQAPKGTSFAVGTEIHLVNRLAESFRPLGKRVITLDESGCLCTTMYRISPQHLAWALENLIEGRVVNRIQIEDKVKHWARVALERMLEIKG
jgi:quinolinate synthase